MAYRSTQQARRELADVAASQGGYFTAKQAADAGYGKRHVDYHVKAGNFERVERGIFRLPTLHFEDDEYFIDNRLREFRMVTPPIRVIDSISFDSTKGRQILEQCVWLTCSECRRTFEVARRSTIDKTWCPECRQMVAIPELFRASYRSRRPR